jgi:hypothetical protein
MNLTFHIPDELAARLGEVGPDLARQALEALMLEHYRAGRVTIDELQEALGFEALNEVDGFLKARGIYEEYTLADLEREQRAMDGAALIAAMQASPHMDIDIEPARAPTPVRKVSL